MVTHQKTILNVEKNHQIMKPLRYKPGQSPLDEAQLHFWHQVKVLGFGFESNTLGRGRGFAVWGNSVKLRELPG